MSHYDLLDHPGQINDDASGLPLSGYVVRVKSETVTATTDTNGYYILLGLASGKYTVYLISNWLTRP